MTLVLDALTAADCELARQWRNREEARLGLRTPYMLTDEMQAAFYRDVVCDRRADSRWFAVRDPDAPDDARDGWRRSPGLPPVMVAMAGLTSIQWEDGHAEISLIVDPARTGQGIGGEAVDLVLREAFGRLRLLTVFGEVVANNPAYGFWCREVDKRGGSGVTVPRRKFWAGALQAAWLFWIPAPDLEMIALVDAVMADWRAPE